MSDADALDASRRRALQRFRAPTTTVFLRAFLPPEILHQVRQFLHDDEQKKQAKRRELVHLMLAIAYRGGRNLTLCLPCARCHRCYCYGTYCNACDAMLWLDLG